MEIERTLVCSTGNLPKDVIDSLSGHWATLSYEEGIMVKTHELEFQDQFLMNILNYARNVQQCDWVRFDRDGPLLTGGFPSWDW